MTPFDRNHPALDRVRASTPGDARVLYVLNTWQEASGKLDRIRRRRLARMHTVQTIRELCCGGRVAVIVWSRDCDHACGESRYEIDANIQAYDAFVERQLSWAEGPMSFRLAHVATPFRAWSRDMVMEAHEDERAHLVSDAFSEGD